MGDVGDVSRFECGLTAGIYSCSPANVARFANELRAVCTYINRHITGAIVGRQRSGLRVVGGGSKARGPDYLHQFLAPPGIIEKTLRQGFAAET